MTSRHPSRSKRHRLRVAVLAALACGTAGTLAWAANADGNAEQSGQTLITASAGDPKATLPMAQILADIQRRLADKGMTAGSPIMIRIFKAEAELELWMRKGDRFELLAVYPICYWSGALGPKQTEGDKQAPEGFYSIGARQMHHKGRWPASMDVGYPNAFDKAHGRTGSYILVHGGCTSTGCYAMTNPVMDEIYLISNAAIENGQKRFQVHIFPFRPTAANLAAHKDSEWYGFWNELKQAYDVFERTRIPPRVSVCRGKYEIAEGTLDQGKEPAAKPATAATGPGAEATDYCGENLVSEVHPEARHVRHRVSARKRHRLARARRAAHARATHIKRHRAKRYAGGNGHAN
jgi:murein L,D-transpeptidase YafK